LWGGAGGPQHLQIDRGDHPVRSGGRSGPLRGAHVVAALHGPRSGKRPRRRSAGLR
jgi:hypothetical protein